MGNFYFLFPQIRAISLGPSPSSASNLLVLHTNDEGDDNDMVFWLMSGREDRLGELVGTLGAHLEK